ncbi:MAG: DNA mismatch repair protein MutS [Rickettsiales bacterium]|nr:DNA mismatch repair protein MutS [Rickettsiales bacterium]
MKLPQKRKPQEPEAIEDKPQAVTPMMQQYLEVKKNHPDILLFYRMGDFYELFFEDAIIAATELEIVLTKRGEHQGKEIPMCGVPHHSYEGYLSKLIKKGYKVGICEQVETPEEAKKLRGYKAVVKREIVRIVTPATITEENLLEGFYANYLICINKKETKFSIGYCDISTGEFYLSNCEKENLFSEIEKLNPKEILISDELFSDKDFSEIFNHYKKIITNFDKSQFSKKRGEEKLKNFYNISTIEALNLNDSELGLTGVLLDYISSTQPNSKPNILFPKKSAKEDFMEIDSASFNNLEIFKSQNGNIKNSLFGVMNFTKTASGARFLQKALAKPLININEIHTRLDNIEFFIQNSSLSENIISCLKSTPDIERIISRVHLNRSSPRDLEALKYGLKSFLDICYLVKSYPNEVPSKIKSLFQNDDNQEILFLLEESIKEQAPPTISEGNFIKENYNAKLDDYRKTKENSENILNNLVEKYRNETGITTLKIKHNNILGFFLEVTPSQIDKIPSYFLHRQTMAGNIRYTTQELREIENKIVNSQSYAIALEIEIYREICEKIKSKTTEILANANSIAELDFFTSLAKFAENKNLTRPIIDETENFILKDAKHPVVENNLKEFSKNNYIANDISLSEEDKIWLITGPNMSGKSTFLRQNAIIAIMAQIGSFVPASFANIGVIDKIFSRVGASDNLAKGHSTFMVEMIETATILNNATSKSLVILDEIGRGTSTYDGISIAWSVLEFIHNKLNCRTLFATHYHELTELNKKLNKISLHTTQTKEWNGEIIFSHKIINGIAGKSYGINVAKLAGLPEKVINRASQILKILEKNNQDNPVKIFSEDLPLFANTNPNNSPNEKEANYISENFENLINHLKNLSPDNLTPKQALEELYKIKSKIS